MSSDCDVSNIQPYISPKRSACDRCRRQKLRCTPQGYGADSCARCARLGTRCVMSRTHDPSTLEYSAGISTPQPLCLRRLEPKTAIPASPSLQALRPAGEGSRAEEQAGAAVVTTGLRTYRSRYECCGSLDKTYEADNLNPLHHPVREDNRKATDTTIARDRDESIDNMDVGDISSPEMNNWFSFSSPLASSLSSAIGDTEINPHNGLISTPVTIP